MLKGYEKNRYGTFQVFSAPPFGIEIVSKSWRYGILTIYTDEGASSLGRVLFR